MGRDANAAADERGRRRAGLPALLLRNRGLILITALTVIVTSAIVYLAMLATVAVDEVDLLASHLSSLPGLLDERMDRLEDIRDEYVEDCSVKTDVGVLLFEEFTEYEDSARLEQIKSSVSAVDVSLVKPDGTIVATTRTEGSFPLDAREVREVLDGDQGQLDRFEDLFSGDGTEESTEPERDQAERPTSQLDVRETLASYGLEAFPPFLDAERLRSGNSLVFEYDYTEFGTFSVEHTGWEIFLREFLSGLDAYAFVWFEDAQNFIGHPQDEQFQDASEQDVVAAFGDDAPLISYTDLSRSDVTEDMRFGVMRIAGTNCLMVRMTVPDYDIRAIIAVPADRLTTGATHATAAFAALVALSLVLLVVFLERTRKQELDDEQVVTVRLLRRRGASGLALTLVVTAAVFGMLILLEVMASTASVTKEQRASLQYQIDYVSRLRDQTQKDHVERGVTRCNALAQMLSKNPGHRDRETLMLLADIVGAQYLMLFDKQGREIYSTNAFSGIAVGTEDDDPTAAYQRVLTGYPYVVTETVHDDVLGTDTHTVASIVTDGEGLPDGFLLMRVDDSEIVARLADASLESTVASHPVDRDQVALVVDDESGEIVGHTDRPCVGEPAGAHLDAALVGRDFEGFTFYDGAYAYLSESSDGGRSVLLVTYSALALVTVALFGILVVAAIVALLSLHYALATRIVARRSRLVGHARGANPLTVFGHGYVAYFFALSIFAFASSHLGRWPSFGFVFGGRWSRGVHLFSVWSTLFAVCWTLMVVIAAKAVLTRLEESANLQVRTLLRLTNSVVTYGAVLACGFWVLSMLGVDTTTLLASAGIASIAIGMGAKDLITDILAGLFLVFEGSIHVGDIVTIGTWRGTVTDMGVRTLEITDESHDVKIFTNSRVTEIVNMSRRKTLCAEEFELRRTVEAEEVPALVDAIIDGVTEEVPELRGTLRMAGITEITEDAYTVRLAYKVDERDRASVTLRLKNALQLLLEGGTEELEEVAGIEPGEEQPGDGADAADDGEGATRPAPNPGEPAAPAR